MLRYIQVMARPDELPENIRTAIHDLLWREVGDYGLHRVTSTVGEDHDGDPVIWVEVDYKAKGKPIDTKIFAALRLKLRDMLWNMGESRFPHVRNHFSERQKILGYP